MIIKVVVKNGFDVGLLCVPITACTITNPNRYESSICYSFFLENETDAVFFCFALNPSRNRSRLVPFC